MPLLAAFSTLIAAEVGGRAVNYRFEPEVRAVLQEAGVASSRDPEVTLRSNGRVNLLAVYEAEGHTQLGLSVSNDGGDSFAPPVPISEKGAHVTSHGESSPSIAYTGTGGMDVYVLWEQMIHGTGAEHSMRADLMFARSLRFGQKFDKPIQVTDKTTPSSNSYAYLAVAPNRDIYAVWLDGREPRTGPPDSSSVYLARSTDHGASFGKNIRVASGACPCCRPTIAFGGNGEIFVAWRKVFEGSIRDIVVGTSHDSGETFGAPVRVFEDKWKITGCPDSGPSMAAKGGRLYVAWYSDGSHNNGGVRVSRSDDGAKTFAPPVMASTNVLDPNHPKLALSEDDRLLLIFQGRDPVQKEGWSPLRAYIAEVADSGAVSPAVAIPGAKKSISYPVVHAATLGRAFVAWTEPTENGGHTIMFTRGRRVQ